MKDIQNSHQFLTIEEVAKLLRVAEATVYRMARKGEIPAVRFGKAWRVKRKELEKIVGEIENIN